MLIFTPEVVGYYEVNLSIEDISEEVIDNKIFYFKAIPETMEVAIIEPKKTTLPYAPPTISLEQSEKQTADRNFALGYFMRENNAFPEGTDLHEILEFYFETYIHMICDLDIMSI